MFTLYLANALKYKKPCVEEHNYNLPNVENEKILPEHLKHHNYDKKCDKTKMIDQQFADDIGWIGNSKQKLCEKEVEISNTLATRNLKINKTKTETISVSKTGNDDWKNCKYLGSYFDTNKDICHRKQLSMAAFQKYKNILLSKKLSISTRMRIFNAYITSIFLYNSGLWTTTQKNM